MKNSFDHVLLIGFGGPESSEEVMPFLRRVTAGRNISDARLLSVAHHYEAIGGKSPYNAWATKLKEDLSRELGLELPVFLGHRNAAPFLKETLLDIHARGFKNGLGLILAPFRSTVSCRRYKENIHEVLHENGITEMRYTYPSPWYHHADWIKLLAELTAKTWNEIPVPIRTFTEILFSCHSIPVMADKACPSCIYSAEYETASRLVAEAMNFSDWKHAYQSRSGSPDQPWLEPDILDAIRQSAKAGKKAVFVIPMGFLSDNAEVLYDLDIEAKKLAEDLGVGFYRVQTPGNYSGLAHFFKKIIEQSLVSADIARGCSV